MSEDPAPVNIGPAPADTVSQVLELLRASTGDPHLDYARPPTRLGGGFWAEIYSVVFADPPAGLSGDLVLRVMPDKLLARKETIVQSGVAAQGFPAPAVCLSGDMGDGSGRQFMVMERAPGGPLMSGLSGPAALLHSGPLIAQLPAVLAETMARLHQLDPEPIRDRLRREGPVAAIEVTDFLENLIVGAEAAGRSDLIYAGRRLQELRRPRSDRVICHGDLHPFNLLVDGDRISVVDWTGALLAEPAYDVAFTWLLLIHAPLDAPAMLRPVIRAASRLVGRSFLRKYRQISPGTFDDDSLNWHVALHCFRTLIEVAGWEAGGDLDRRAGHPWLTSRATFAHHVSQLTGVTVTAA
jgi:aminoglycoside phosphotransferase (APT) family kinase protein